GDTGFTTDLPKALYHLLKAKGWRTSLIVSSLNRNMLYTIQDAGWADGVNLNLMQVYGATISPSANEIAIVKQLGFRYINVNVNDWSFSTVNYAKDIGLYVAGWHWQLTNCEAANSSANGYDLDIMMTDCIGNLQAKGWF
ncbi:MAG: hypothetical protein H7Z42_09350, partial [Roseiflexaceae bacterium]|nr:hypothetical protein [Roseiflexaceae bacterium]